jgi:hypothetical protein
MQSIIPNTKNTPNTVYTIITRLIDHPELNNINNSYLNQKTKEENKDDIYVELILSLRKLYSRMTAIFLEYDLKCYKFNGDVPEIDKMLLIASRLKINSSKKLIIDWIEWVHQTVIFLDYVLPKNWGYDLI